MMKEDISPEGETHMGDTDLIDQLLNAGLESWRNISNETLARCKEGPPRLYDPASGHELTNEEALQLQAIWWAVRCGELQACVIGLLEVLEPTTAVSAGRHAAGF
jgi:hypothetical protein